MTSCANCTAAAVYLVNNKGAENQAFCEKHLPWFINRRALGDKVIRLDVVPPAPASTYTEEPAPVAEVKEEPKKSSKKKAEVTPEPEAEVEDRADSSEASAPVSSKGDETDGSVSTGASEPA